MAMHVHPQWIGIDVSKATLSVAVYGEARAETLANEPGTIRAWLRALPANAALAVEATNTYHFTVLELAQRRGLVCYLLDGYRLNRYRESLGIRAKTDAGDAAPIARFLAHEHRGLRPWQRPPAGYRSLHRLPRPGCARARLRYPARTAPAHQARRCPTWAAFYERCLQRGLASTQALVILARKLARIAFALMKNQSQYQPPITTGACNAT